MMKGGLLAPKVRVGLMMVCC